MPRGRLINKLNATFALLDSASTVYDSDYHDVAFGETKQETTITIPCQVEEATWFRAAFKYHGIEQDGEITLILHYEDIEFFSMLDTNNQPLISIGSRLVSLAKTSGVSVVSYPDPPGMYVVQARDSSYGLAMDQNPTRNLLILLLSPRPKAV